MRFPAIFTPEETGYSITFPDVPEAITQGDSLEEGQQNASDALESALDFYFDDKRMIPTPSHLKRGQRWVDLPVSVSAKALLHNEMLAQGVRPAELARRLSVPQPEINRILNPRHNTKIDTIAAALKALGKTLELQAV